MTLAALWKWPTSRCTLATSPTLSRRIDGCYNRADHPIRGLILHCVHPAREGGSNRLLDHEIAHLMLRELNPDFIAALMHPRAMCIPANEVDGKTLRPEVCGPVFSTDRNGHLHMRYTARGRDITWRDDTLTRAAVTALATIIEDGSPYQFEDQLDAGQGLICNNVLHTRSAFETSSRRLPYRARCFDRIAEPQP